MDPDGNPEEPVFGQQVRVSIMSYGFIKKKMCLSSMTCSPAPDSGCFFHSMLKIQYEVSIVHLFKSF